MRLYPASRTGRTRTLASDLFVVALLVLFAWLGMKTHDVILDLTVIGREVQDSGRAISATTRDTAGAIDNAFSDAGDAVAGVPLVGDQIARALRAAPRDATSSLRATGDEQGAKLVRLGVEQVRRTEQVANWAGWLIFLLPSLLLLARTVPARVRKVIGMSEAQRMLAGAPEHMLAARAAFSLPYATLRRYTKDPFGDLDAGRYGALVKALADEAAIELETGPAGARAAERADTRARRGH